MTRLYTTKNLFRLRFKASFTGAAPYLLPVIIGALLSLSWYSLPTIGLLALFPLLWLIWPTRIKSTLFIFAFYLTADWEIILDSSKFFTSDHTGIIGGIGIWLFQAIVYTLPWAILYSAKRHWLNLTVRTLAVLFLLTIPPLGYLVWLPQTASSGALFPNMGWVGFALTIFFMLLTVFTLCVRKKGWPILVCLVILLVSVITNTAYSPKTPPKNWVAINTRLGDAPANFFAIPKRESALINLASKALAQGNKVLLFPENIALDWLEGTKLQWQRISQEAKEKGATIVLGAQQDLADGSMNNMLILLGEGDGKTYPARQPMPFGLWKPWQQKTYNLHWNLPGKFSLYGQKVGYLICYEQIIPWPILSSFLTSPKPTIILSAANQWFATMSGYTKQHNNMLSFARLFGVPTLTAINTALPSDSS